MLHEEVKRSSRYICLQLLVYHIYIRNFADPPPLILRFGYLIS